MNVYQKLWAWFRGLSKWAQIAAITGASVLLIVGIWSTSFGYETRSAADLTNSTGWMVSIFLKLLVVLALIYGSAIALKKWMKTSARSNHKRMQVIETVALNPKRALHLVTVGGKTLLIGATDQQVNLIQDISALDELDDFPEVLVKAVEKAGIGGLDE